MRMYSLAKYVFRSLAHFKNWVDCFPIELKVYFILWITQFYQIHGFQVAFYDSLNLDCPQKANMLKS